MEDKVPKEIIREKIPPNTDRAILASGCFWCLETVMEATEGIVSAINGYAGGQEFDPTYQEVYTGKTGHREAVVVYYDPRKISYSKVLDVFWRNIDPTDAGGQFFDRGSTYTTAIFYETSQQKQQAETSKAGLAKAELFEKPIVTEIIPFTTFYEAEQYHQGFSQKSPLRYQQYSQASGRQQFKELVWKQIQKSK